MADYKFPDIPEATAGKEGWPRQLCALAGNYALPLPVFRLGSGNSLEIVLLSNFFETWRN